MNFYFKISRPLFQQFIPCLSNYNLTFSMISKKESFLVKSKSSCFNKVAGFYQLLGPNCELVHFQQNGGLLHCMHGVAEFEVSQVTNLCLAYIHENERLRSTSISLLT